MPMCLLGAAFTLAIAALAAFPPTAISPAGMVAFMPIHAPEETAQRFKDKADKEQGKEEAEDAAKETKVMTMHHIRRNRCGIFASRRKQTQHVALRPARLIGHGADHTHQHQADHGRYGKSF